MALAGAAEVKLYLRLETTAEDTLLTAIVLRVVALIESYLDRPIVAVAREWEDRTPVRGPKGANTVLRFPTYPISAATITDADGDVVDADDYVLVAATGKATCENGFTNGPYTLAATVGLDQHQDYEDRIEPLLSAAIVDLAADLFQRRSPAAQGEGAGGAYAQWSSLAELPARTKQMLDPLRQVGAY